MHRIIFLLVIFFSTHQNLYAQTSNGHMLFVIDSIPVRFDPQPMNDLWEEDIASRIAVKNDKGLQLQGISNIDSITYIFTNEWVNRPDSVKRYPSLKQLEMKDSAWNLYGNVYTGKYIDYYYSGKKMTEGSLLNGRQDGEEIFYFQNGLVGRINHYEYGKRIGISIHYYKDGHIQSKGMYSEFWKWEGESYFPNGALESQTTVTDSAGGYRTISYFSSGKIRQVNSFYKNGNIKMDSAMRKSIVVFKKLEQLKDAANWKTAKKIAREVVELDSINTDVYTRLGVFMLEKKYFNDAIKAFDSALEMEPFSMQALFFRAYTRTGRYESKHPRKWVKPKNGETMILNPVDTKFMPASEKEKICADLLRADLLRTIYTFSFDGTLVEISKTYCGMDVRR